MVLGVVCILFAFLYTTLLSYRGWGDVLVLVFFGFVPVCGTYYVQAYTLNMDVVVLSLVSGLAIDTLLMVNNYRDREQDAVSGKCTLVVRYGKKFGENMYLALVIAAVLERIKMCKAILIICDDKDPICNFVMRKLVRGATYTPCFGAYTDKPHYMIYTTLTNREAGQLQEFIHKENLNAFISMLSTTEVFGKGFNHA